MGGIVIGCAIKHVANATQKGKKWLVVVDGQAGAVYDQIGKGSPIFGPDGSLEYLAIREHSLYRVQYVPTR